MKDLSPEWHKKAENYSEMHQDVSGEIGRYLVKAVYIDGATEMQDAILKGIDNEIKKLNDQQDIEIQDGEGDASLETNMLKLEAEIIRKLIKNIKP